MNYFKTQQEIWKYVANGGAVINDIGTIIKFENAKLNLSNILQHYDDWSPYIEPVAKTKVPNSEREI